MRASIVLTLAVVQCTPLTASAAVASANPIRKVVTMLQVMQKKVEAEGAKETELYDKFMCYCKTSGGTLKDSVAAAETKLPTATAELDETRSKHTHSKESLKTMQEDRVAAKAAIKDAAALRSKAAAEFAKEKGESDASIATLTGAIAALKKGLTGFLQTSTARFLKNMILAREDLAEYDRDELVSFLSGGESSPGTSEVVGILETMKTKMEKALSEASAAEEAGIKSTKEVIAAKTKEIAALTEQIEATTARIGDLGIKAVQIQQDLSDTEEQVIADKKFLADMETNCATKTSEYEENQKLRSEELVALADTIKVLNDDDALDLFKKTLPGASSSFLQMNVSPRAQRNAALAKLTRVRRRGGKGRLDMNFIALAIMGKKNSFGKVITMIDNMIAEIKEEQLGDDHKKEYCESQIDDTKTKVATLKKSISDVEAASASMEEDISTVTGDIETLGAQIKDLDKKVAEATAQRQEESKVYNELMASDAAAKQLLEFAKNRLNKFYNPVLYKAAPTTTLDEMDTLYVAGGGAADTTPAPGGIAGTGVEAASFEQVSAHMYGEVAPPPPPETAAAYTKKSKESTGVIAMITLIIKDLSKEMDEAEEDEKTAQHDYEEMAKDSTEQRQMYSKQLVEKESAKAEMETSLQTDKESAAGLSKELMATDKYLADVHTECDWLLQYFDVRKEARIGEIESLKNAKAVLSGADYSLVQVHRAKSLRGVM